MCTRSPSRRRMAGDPERIATVLDRLLNAGADSSGMPAFTLDCCGSFPSSGRMLTKNGRHSSCTSHSRRMMIRWSLDFSMDRTVSLGALVVATTSVRSTTCSGNTWIPIPVNAEAINSVRIGNRRDAANVGRAVKTRRTHPRICLFCVIRGLLTVPIDSVVEASRRQL